MTRIARAVKKCSSVLIEHILNHAIINAWTDRTSYSYRGVEHQEVAFWVCFGSHTVVLVFFFPLTPLYVAYIYVVSNNKVVEYLIKT